MLVAIGLYLAAAFVVLYLEERLLHHAHGIGPSEWVAEHVYIPLLRIATLLVFIFAAHPDLFGVAEAPGVSELLRADGHRFDAILNTTLLVTLFLPFVPGINRFAGVIFALQGIVAVCVLFSWTAPALGVEDPRYWMGWSVLATSMAFAVAGELIARYLRDRAMSRERRGLITDAAQMLLELPAVLVYSYALGAQL